MALPKNSSPNSSACPARRSPDGSPARPPPDVYILSDLSEIFEVSADNLLNGVNEISASAAAPPPAEPTEISAEAVATAPLRAKLKFAAAVIAIAAVTVTVNIGIIKAPPRN